MSALYLQGGTVIEEVAGHSDDIVKRFDAAAAAGEAWTWFQVKRPTDASYTAAEFEPLAVRTLEVQAVRGPTREQVDIFLPPAPAD